MNNFCKVIFATLNGKNSTEQRKTTTSQQLNSPAHYTRLRRTYG